MDIEAARDQRRRLQTELDEINGRVRTHEIGNVLQVLKIEIRHLDDEIDFTNRCLKEPDEQRTMQKIPLGVLNMILVECKLICAKSVTIFSSMLKAELYSLMAYSEPFPCTAQLVEKVLAELEEYLIEKRIDEVEYYGFSDTNKYKDVGCSCNPNKKPKDRYHTSGGDEH